jgi:hypothetical protein
MFRLIQCSRSHPSTDSSHRLATTTITHRHAQQTVEKLQKEVDAAPPGPEKEHLQQQLERAQGHLKRMDGHLQREKEAHKKASFGSSSFPMSVPFSFFPSLMPTSADESHAHPSSRQHDKFTDATTTPATPALRSSPLSSLSPRCPSHLCLLSQSRNSKPPTRPLFTTSSKLDYNSYTTLMTQPLARSFERRKLISAKSTQKGMLTILVRPLPLVLSSLLSDNCPFPQTSLTGTTASSTTRTLTRKSSIKLIESVRFLSVLAPSPCTDPNSSVDHLSAVHRVHSSREKLKAAEDKLHNAQTAHPDPERVHRAEIRLHQAQESLDHAKEEEKHLRAGTSAFHLSAPFMFFPDSLQH